MQNIAYIISLLIFGYFIVSNDNLTVILAGVSIFIIGMYFMQDGFKQLSGGILEKLLQKFTSNSYYAILTGIISTTVVQSSTITTLLTISFVGTGLLTLAQGIGVIFGSNLGSSTTAWIVASLGVDVKIAAYAFPMVVFGVILRFSISYPVRGLCIVLLGLGFIFLGIAYMKDGFEEFKETIDLASFAMEGYLGILVYIAIGLVVTVVVQSSAATMAIIITALNLDSITYDNALSLTIGANVGTVLTAYLVALTSNENAQRVALSHVLFNFITATVVTKFVFQIANIIDVITPYLVISDSNYGIKLSLFHSLYSIIGILILTPFIPQIEKFLNKLVKDKKTPMSEPKYLSMSIVGSPDAALVALRKEVINLYEHCQKAMLHALNIHTTNLNNETLQKQLSSKFSVIDTDIDEIYQKDIKNLYSEIIKYSSFAQEHMFDFQHKEAGEFKRSAAILVEVLKDIRDVQKNVNYYLKSKNEFIKKEYNILRKEIAEILIDINILATMQTDIDKLTQLEVIKVTLAENDFASSEEIDMLFREDKITATMATSYINDSATGYSIQKKLVEVAKILFLSDDLLKQIGENEHEFK